MNNNKLLNLKDFYVFESLVPSRDIVVFFFEYEHNMFSFSFSVKENLPFPRNFDELKGEFDIKCSDVLNSLSLFHHPNRYMQPLEREVNLHAVLDRFLIELKIRSSICGINPDIRRCLHYASLFIKEEIKKGTNPFDTISKALEFFDVGFDNVERNISHA